MYPRPRLLAIGSLAVALVVLAVLVDNPLLLLGAAAVWSWIIARQVAFAIELERTIDSLSVTRELERTTLQAGDTVPVTLAAAVDSPSRLRLSIDGRAPTAATTDDTNISSVTLEPGMSDASVSRPLTWPVAGRHEFGSVTVTATDGFVREALTIDGAPTVTVEPDAAAQLHVGAAGKHIGMAYGDHERGRLDSGEVPSESREYVPGDTADKIDWKATARLGTTYVREAETETDRPLLLVVDHRSPLADGPARTTKFDFLRDVALSVATQAVRRGEPVSLVAVDDDGISTNIDQAAASGGFRTIRRRLHDLEPTATQAETKTKTPANAAERLTGDEARRRLHDLDGSGLDDGTDDPFTETLRSFYAERARGTDRVAVGSLADGVTIASPSRRQRQRTVIVSDDSHPGDLRTTVSLAQNRGNEVLVFLAPSVLYEDRTRTQTRDAADGDRTRTRGQVASHADPNGVAEDPFDRYLEFEDFRRELARMDQVTALEVGPADRLSTVLQRPSTATDRGESP